MKKLIIIIMFLLVGAIVFWKWFFNQPFTPPEKPNNIPAEAIWSGGSDGGEWIQLVEIKEEIYRFRIYQDWSGDLKMDADFEFNVDKFSLTYANWKSKICCYSQSLDSLVTLSVVEGQNKTKKLCNLQSIYPAYGGSDWEIIKEKYKIK